MEKYKCHFCQTEVKKEEEKYRLTFSVLSPDFKHLRSGNFLFICKKCFASKTDEIGLWVSTKKG